MNEGLTVIIIISSSALSCGLYNNLQLVYSCLMYCVMSQCFYSCAQQRPRVSVGAVRM